MTLTATNANGTSTSTPTPLTYDNRVPVAANCAPATTSYCCNYGIVKVQLGTINQASADASAGYEDFSCPQRTELRVGEAYPLSISTGGTLNHATRAYLDLNNDGAFSASELLFSAPDARNPSTMVRVPAASALLNQPLRLRVLTDFVGATLTPCGPLLNGQAEDYTVILRASTGLATRPTQTALPGLSVFPTPLPAGNLLHLALAEAGAAGLYSLRVENLLGARLLQASRRLGPTLDATLDLGALPPGVYVLRLRDAQGREALRRVVRE